MTCIQMASGRVIRVKEDQAMILDHLVKAKNVDKYFALQLRHNETGRPVLVMLAHVESWS